MADVNIKIQLESAKAQRDLARLTAQTAKFEAQVSKANLSAKRAQQGIENLGNSAKKTRNAFSVANISLASFIGNITSRAVTAGINSVVNGFQEIINRGRAFESALIGVGKTTGIAGNELQKLGKDIQDIGKRIPVSTSRLLELATVAGQLGLNTSTQIEKFTETVAKLELATDIAGEEGAQAIAKILDITGELGEDGPQNIEKFGNVIVNLGNNFAATESQIVKVANEVAKGTAVFGVASEDVLGLATAFKVTGSEAEISGSSINKIFTEIGKAVTAGGEDLTRFAEAANLTNEQFAEIFRQDPTDGFLALAKGLQESGKEGSDLVAVLEELGFNDRRVQRSLGPLITRYETFERAIRSARTEASELNALTEETRAAQNSLDADLTKLNNSFDRLASSIFDSASPALRSLVQDLTSFTGLLADTISETEFSTKSFKNYAAVLLEVSSGYFSLTSTNSAFVEVLRQTSLSLQGVTNDFSPHLDKVKEIEEGYKDLDSEGKNFLNTLNQLTSETQDTIAPLKATNIELVKLKDNYVQVGDAAEEATERASAAAKSLLAFETDKLKELKQFYTEDERAAIEANFRKLEGQKKQEEEFLKTIAQIGQERRRQEALAVIGQDKATLESKRKLAEQLKEIRNKEKAAEDELALQREVRRVKEEGDNQLFNETKLQQVRDFYTEEEKIRLTAEVNLIENERLKQAKLTEILADGLNNRSEREIKTAKEVADAIIEQDNRELEAKRKTAEQEERIRSLTLRSTGQFFGAAARLAATGGKRTFEIAKALSIAQVIINGIQQVSEAAKLPWPANIPATAFAVADSAARLVTIKQQQAPSFEQGGIVSGTSFTGDRISANVNSGEMILNRQQQSNLFSIANGRGLSAPQQAPINITTKVVLEDDTVIGEATSRWVANGGQLGEVQ
jgi:TP901 family phage tail tape measure protein